METSIFQRDGKTWTRFKVKVKELRIYARLLKKWVDIEKPVKPCESCRFKPECRYANDFEVEECKDWGAREEDEE